MDMCFSCVTPQHDGAGEHAGLVFPFSLAIVRLNIPNFPPSSFHCKVVRIYHHTRVLSCSTQMKQEMESILQLLLPLARDLSSSEVSQGPDQQEDLQIMLQQLKGVAETLTQMARTQVSSSLKPTHPAPNGSLKKYCSLN